jgi:hypothetical protein
MSYRLFVNIRNDVSPVKREFKKSEQNFEDDGQDVVNQEIREIHRLGQDEGGRG